MFFFFVIVKNGRIKKLNIFHKRANHFAFPIFSFYENLAQRLYWLCSHITNRRYFCLNKKYLPYSRGQGVKAKVCIFLSQDQEGYNVKINDDRHFKRYTANLCANATKQHIWSFDYFKNFNFHKIWINKCDWAIEMTSPISEYGRFINVSGLLRFTNLSNRFP